MQAYAHLMALSWVAAAEHVAMVLDSRQVCGAGVEVWQRLLLLAMQHAGWWPRLAPLTCDDDQYSLWLLLVELLCGVLYTARTIQWHGAMSHAQ